ncbi:CPBP family intramembrane glutamic endopeptidase [Priestia koreensis]|uniref:CPBP family intramembrane glutamic endopeptidase n=1 Tax=Priestia koreensis TaxID=284581 RepID=UPI003459B441
MASKQSEIVAQMSDRQLIGQVYITQGILVVLSLGLGFWLFDHWEQFWKLWKWDPQSIFLFGGISGLMVVVLDNIMMKVLPERLYDDGGINERIFRNRSFKHLTVLCMMIAFTEEILFRGVLQANLGILWASIVFALVHIRYLTKWFLLLSVVVLSFFIGWLFQATGNLWVTIFAHFIIDFLLGIQLKYRNVDE